MAYTNRTPLLGLFYEAHQLRNANWGALDTLIAGAFTPGSPIQLPPGYGDPPFTGLVYGRGGTSSATMAWRPALPLAGGTMGGDIMLARDPTLALHAVTKQYVDWVFSTGSVYRGDWQVAANLPDLNNLVPPPVPGDRWFALTADPAVPELPPPGIPGIDPTIPIAQGTWIQRNATNTAWATIVGGGLTKFEADLLYLSLTGGTLTGGLDIAMNGPRLTLHETNLLNPTLAGMRWIRGDLTEGWGLAVDWPGRRLLIERRDLAGAVVDVPFEISEVDGIAAFSAIPTAVGIPLTQDVPVDTVVYARQDRTWVDATALFDDLYVNVVGDRMTGPLLLAADPVVPLQAATKQYVDLNKGIVASDTPPANPLPNTLWFDSTDGELYFYYQDVDSVQWVEVGGAGGAAASGAALVGDVKQGFQTADHEGWIKLDGRLVSTLTATQQAQAVLLGFATNLPDATNAVALQNGGVPGTVSGSMSRTLTQANLPNVTLTAANAAVLTTSGHDAAAVTTSGVSGGSGTTSSAGAHSHTCTIWRSNGGGISDGFGKRTDADQETADYAGLSTDGAHTHTFSTPAHTHTVDLPNHTHTVPAHGHTVPLGGSGTALDITPQALAVNTFVFLGA